MSKTEDVQFHTYYKPVKLLRYYLLITCDSYSTLYSLHHSGLKIDRNIIEKYIL